MIIPSCFRYNENNDNHELYLSEFSTSQGLGLFQPHQQIEVTKAGGMDIYQNEWIDENSLLTIKTSEVLIEYLDRNKKINWVDIEIDLKNFGTLRTHDNGECHFRSFSKNLIFKLVENCFPNKDSLPLEQELIDNPGFYIQPLTSGNYARYKTFDDYLKSNYK